MEHKNLKLTAEHYDIKITIELTKPEADLTELLGLFKSLAIGLGYQQESWDAVICDAYDSICADFKIIE